MDIWRNSGSGFGNDNGGDRGVIEKVIVIRPRYAISTGKLIRDGDGLQLSTTTESTSANRGDIGTHDDIVYPVAAGECVLSNRGNGIGNCYCGKQVTVIESIASNTGHPLSKNNLLDLCPFSIPRRAAGIIFRHRPFPRDRQRTRIVKRPREVVPAGAACDDLRFRFFLVDHKGTKRRGGLVDRHCSGGECLEPGFGEHKDVVALFSGKRK